MRWIEVSGRPRELRIRLACPTFYPLWLLGLTSFRPLPEMEDVSPEACLKGNFAPSVNALILRSKTCSRQANKYLAQLIRRGMPSIAFKQQVLHCTEGRLTP